MKTTKTLQKSELKNKKVKQPNTIGLTFKAVFTKYKCLFTIVVISIILSALAGVVGSMFIQTLIADYIEPLKVMENPDFSGLITALLYMAGIYLTGALCALLYNQLMIVISQNTMRNIRNDMFIKMQKLPVKYFDTKNNGDIMSYFSNDTDTMLQLLSQGIPQLINLIATMLAVMVSMFILSPILAGCTIVYGGIMMFVAKTIGSKSVKYFAGQQKSISEVNSYVEEMIGGQRVVKVFNHEEVCKNEFAQINDRWRDASFRAVKLACTIMPIMSGMGHLLYVLIALIGGSLVIFGVAGTSLAAVVAFLPISRSFIMPINQFAEQINNFAMATAGSRRIFQLLSEEEEVDKG